MAPRLVAWVLIPGDQVNEEVIAMEQTSLTNWLDNLKQDPLRSLELLEQAIFCQRVEQFWEDAARP
ncbi:MAG: hypothetical protein GY803_29530 [Chloroflexi bacterium]|nr:hypothetical protein [Chloroflexota bacterium]